MQLRYSADRRTLVWTLILMPCTVGLQYANPEWLPYLSWLSFYFAMSSATIAHNHLHCPTFKSKAWSQAFGDWISVFYGYPTFVWIPTHNLNHHRLVNKPGDATITWRLTNSHNLFIAVTYFFVSSYYQAEPINAFIRKAKEHRPAQYWRIMRQYVIVFGSQAAMLALACGLHGFGTGIKVWAFTLGLPAFFALWTVMLFNYEQHVHTDPWSVRNHSRNFVGPLANFLLFNNGFHTAHHEKADLHWSELPALHRTFEHEIAPELKQYSLFWYWTKQYLLSAVIPSLGTKQIGRAPFDVRDGESAERATEDVELVESGTNAARA